MNIAFIARKYHAVGGAGKDLFEMTRHLVSWGHEVHVYCSEVATIPVEGLHVHKIPKVGMGRTGALKTLAINGPAEAYAGKHDLVYSWSRSMRQHAVRCGGDVYDQLRGRLYPELAEGPGFFSRFSSYRRLAAKVERRQFDPDRVMRVTAKSYAMKQEIIDAYNVPESFVDVIYPAVDAQVYSPGLLKKHRESVRTQFQIPPFSTILLFVGNGFKEKGVDSLVIAMRRLKKKQVYALVVGKDPRIRLYREIARKYDLTSNIMFVGGQMDIGVFLGAADLFVLPAHQDSFGDEALMAMSCGVPVIVSRAAGIAELIPPQLQEGILEDPSDYKTLADKITKWSDPDLRLRLGDFARQTAMKYDWETRARLFAEQCEELIERRRET